jgi:hypothetical protein
MREAGLKESGRALWWALAVGVLLMAVGVACGEDTGGATRPGATSSGATSPEATSSGATSSGATSSGASISGLAGTWVTASGYEDVTMVLQEDGTFTWDNRTLRSQATGTWAADASTFTFSFVEDEAFCPGGTLTWEYRLDGDTLTSEGLGSTCGGPDIPYTWEFERQPGS